MSETLRSTFDIQGELNTRIVPQRKPGSYGATLHHKLNMPLRHYAVSDSQFTGADLVSWRIDAWDLQNGAQNVLPPYYGGEEFDEENSGNLLLAYFPLNDFKEVLTRYKKATGKSRGPVLKEGLKYGINKIRNVLSGGGSVEIAFDQTFGVSFPSGKEDYSEAKSTHDHYKNNVKDLKRRMKLAKRMGMTHIVIQYGYDTAEGQPSDRSKLGMVIIGNRQSTEDLMEKMGTDPKTVGEVLTKLFSPNGDGITYEASAGLDLNPDAFFAFDKYKSGEYNPFQNATQLKLFDYRLK